MGDNDKLSLIQTVYAHKTEECRLAPESLRWWSRCCNSNREASILVAPDAAAKRKRQCYAYLGGGQLSVASTTLLHNIVVKVKTWHMGACVIAACTLLNRASEDTHRVSPLNPDLFISADDTVVDEDMLDAMCLEDDTGDPLPPQLSNANQFGLLCEDVTARSAALVGLSWPVSECGVGAAAIWKACAERTSTVSDPPGLGGCQPQREPAEAGRQTQQWQGGRGDQPRQWWQPPRDIRTARSSWEQ